MLQRLLSTVAITLSLPRHVEIKVQLFVVDVIYNRTPRKIDPSIFLKSIHYIVVWGKKNQSILFMPGLITTVTQDVLGGCLRHFFISFAVASFRRQNDQTWALPIFIRHVIV